MGWTRRLLAFTLCAWFGCSVAAAQDVVVNDLTMSSQDEPDTCSDGAGAFVVVWTSYQENSGRIRVQRFSPDGERLGEEMKLDPRIDGFQPSYGSTPAVACFVTGGFVVVWKQNQPMPLEETGPSERVIKGQRFAADGQAQGEAFLITNLESLLISPSDPDVATDPQGRFVVLWAGGGLDEGRLKGWVAAQRFNSSGLPVGDPIQISEPAFLDKVTLLQTGVSKDGQGRFIASWIERNHLGKVRLLLRRFEANGTPLDSTRTIVDASQNVQQGKLQHGPEDGFWVVWQQADGQRTSLRGQRFSSQGERLGAIQVFNGPAGYYQHSPNLAIGPDGKMLVLWEDIRVCLASSTHPISNQPYCVQYGESQEGGEGGLRGRFYDATGQPLGAESPLNSHVPGLQKTTALTALGNGRFFVAWVDRGLQQPCVPDDFDPHPCYVIYEDSLDGSGSAIAGAIRSVPPDTQPPQLVHGPMVSFDENEDLVLSWLVDEAASTDLLLEEKDRAQGSAIWIALPSKYGQATIRGLKNRTRWHYRLKLTDWAGNVSVFTGPPDDIVIRRTRPLPVEVPESVVWILSLFVILLGGLHLGRTTARV